MSEPTLDQLANFATVRCFGPGVGASSQLTRMMFEASPTLVERWREIHAQFQRDADALAARSCSFCQGSGSVVIEEDTYDCLRCGGSGEAA